MSEDTATMSVDEYIAFLSISVDEVVLATNRLSSENLLTQGTSYDVYKGQLSQSGDLIDIVARDCVEARLALNELVILKNLNHKNIMTLFKIYISNTRYVMINKYEANGSLNKHISDPTLTWMHRLRICVGVAHALKYLHYDAEDNHYVIHGNIKSSKILLGHDWEPKLHGFAFAVRAKKGNLHLTSKYNGSIQYMDPTYENTGGLTHKSDVFSFGVLLFEVLFGREASVVNNDNWYFAQLARSHYEERKLDDLIVPDLRKQMDLQSFNIFAETAYCCLKEKRTQRPNMNQILFRLERALELQYKHEHSTTALEGTSSNHLKGRNLDHLKFRLNDIELATNKFSKTYCIGSGGYGMVYKAELEHFDGINSLAVEGKGLPSIVRQCFNEGTLEKLVDPNLKETDEIISNQGVNQDSLDTFSKIAYQCLAETQKERPTMEVIIKELEKALNFQASNSFFSRIENNMDNLHIPLEAIKLSTRNFSVCNLIGEGMFWKLYEGELVHANGRTSIIAKRWDNESHHRHVQFLTELEVLKYKHENIIGLVGYSVRHHQEKGNLDEMIFKGIKEQIVSQSLTIFQNTAIRCLHDDGYDSYHRPWPKEVVIQLEKALKFQASILLSIHLAEHVDDKTCDSLGYVDPDYQCDGFLTESSDIYSLGVIFFEILCGKLAWGEGCESHSQSLGPLAVRHYIEKGNLDEMIFEGIKEQIAPLSLTTFQTIAIQCLHDNLYDRPWTNEIIIQLTKALKFQEDYEVWEAKLPIDYKEIIQMSKAPEIYDYKMKKDLFDMFSKGILLRDGKVLFSLGSNGERNEMISAKKFTYKNHLLPKWRSLPESSRFLKVAEMFDISSLNVLIKLRTQFLSPSVNYKVHLFFRFCSTRRSRAKQMYVNLKYKIGNESLHAYFATWREDGWMMIELFQFLNHKKNTNFEVLLESFSRCYCGSDSIYIEGIQFQAIDNASLKIHFSSHSILLCCIKGLYYVLKFYKTVSETFMQVKHEEVEKLDEVRQVKKSKSKANEVFSGVIEILRQQVLCIKCKIKSQMLSPNSQNVCYLVFKLSEKFCGLHGPVTVRDLFHYRSKETRILYFRYPKIWNMHDTDWVPRKRKDGWMEVILWKYNSNYELKNDHLFVNLKLVTYEGTMSGLIVRGIKFRSI
ncbi:hypothetical protein E3N88_33093 [Mikania micrantha]|uniref:Protein kinase domain-containing protein n=1 Tax=Mikania micrantha TaxID=192012 RepID=A0A5N6MAZ1_9ASTR|nr:hypothetical protein E3N88_33093 [Mikania micrantha]